MIGDVAQSRWTLRFRDPALERAYHDDLALELRSQVSVMLAVLTLVWIASGVFDRNVAGSPANGDVLVWTRVVLTPLFVATVALNVLLPRARFLRWSQWLVWPVVASTGAMFVGALWLMPDPERFPIAAGVEALLLAGFAFALLYGLPFVVIAWSLSAVAIAFLASTTRYPQISVSDTSNTVSGTLVAMVGAYVLEAARRRSFLANARADRLLENVMPAPIAERLKHGERRIAEHHDAATVLFADLVGFTAIAEKLPPGELVDTLDDVFSTFDDLAERHGLEKIKTIGDAYMVVGGVPTARADHAHAVAAMALEMRDAVAARGGAWQIRIGIHTGPVVAGVIGKRKFIYDLWGDTVNLASRMEAHGVAGAIQVSAATAAALDGAFVLEPRGPIAIKGKGELPAYLLSGTVPP